MGDLHWYGILWTHRENWVVFIPPSEIFVKDIIMVSLWRLTLVLSDIHDRGGLMIQLVSKVMNDNICLESIVKIHRNFTRDRNDEYIVLQNIVIIVYPIIMEDTVEL